MRKNVVMKKDSMTLYTEWLDYDISKDIGKYLTGGRTISGQDTLVSQRGYFYANEDEIYFKEKVRIYNPKYTIFTDTLKHNTKRNKPNQYCLERYQFQLPALRKWTL
jgi:hypothetical protein